MASQYVQKQSQYDALARQRTHPSRKYYDYHAETSQSLEGPRRREAQMPRRAAQYVPLENASRRMPVDASALRGYTPSRAVVPRALPVQPSPASLRREGRMHGAGHSHSRSFDYYNTAEAHATPGSGPIFPSSIQAIRQTVRALFFSLDVLNFDADSNRYQSTAHYSKSQYRQPVESPLAYRPAQPQASQPLRKPRVALECTVCGPGAVGPWQVSRFHDMLATPS